MKKLLLLIVVLSFASCSKKQSIPTRVAEANGIENWNKINEIAFTFNVDRDSAHIERSWVWKPKDNQVTAISQKDTITYERKIPLDPAYIDTDKSFINDKYWLLAPFNLVWDKGFTHKYEEGVSAPISGENLNKLTIVYGNEGGYTPGDAYDFFMDENNIIREWAYRKENAPEPTLITTWEDYSEKGGINMALTHKNKEGNFKLYFSNVTVKTD